MAAHISDTLSDKENRRCGYFLRVAHGIPVDYKLAMWGIDVGWINLDIHIKPRVQKGSGLLVNIVNDLTYK